MIPPRVVCLFPRAFASWLDPMSCQSLALSYSWPLVSSRWEPLPGDAAVASSAESTGRPFRVGRLNAGPAADGVASIVEVPVATEAGSEGRSRLSDERAQKGG